MERPHLCCSAVILDVWHVRFASRIPQGLSPVSGGDQGGVVRELHHGVTNGQVPPPPPKNKPPQMAPGAGRGALSPAGSSVWAEIDRALHEGILDHVHDGKSTSVVVKQPRDRTLQEGELATVQDRLSVAALVKQPRAKVLGEVESKELEAARVRSAYLQNRLAVTVDRCRTLRIELTQTQRTSQEHRATLAGTRKRVIARIVCSVLWWKRVRDVMWAMKRWAVGTAAWSADVRDAAGHRHQRAVRLLENTFGRFSMARMLTGWRVAVRTTRALHGAVDQAAAAAVQAERRRQCSAQAAAGAAAGEVALACAALHEVRLDLLRVARDVVSQTMDAQARAAELSAIAGDALALCGHKATVALVGRVPPEAGHREAAPPWASVPEAMEYSLSLLRRAHRDATRTFWTLDSGRDAAAAALGPRRGRALDRAMQSVARECSRHAWHEWAAFCRQAEAQARVASVRKTVGALAAQHIGARSHTSPVSVAFARWRGRAVASALPAISAAMQVVRQREEEMARLNVALAAAEARAASAEEAFHAAALAEHEVHALRHHVAHLEARALATEAATARALDAEAARDRAVVASESAVAAAEAIGVARRALGRRPMPGAISLRLPSDSKGVQADLPQDSKGVQADMQQDARVATAWACMHILARQRHLGAGLRVWTRAHEERRALGRAERRWLDGRGTRGGVRRRPPVLAMALAMWKERGTSRRLVHRASTTLSQSRQVRALRLLARTWAARAQLTKKASKAARIERVVARARALSQCMDHAGAMSCAGALNVWRVHAAVAVLDDVASLTGLHGTIQDVSHLATESHLGFT